MSKPDIDKLFDTLESTLASVNNAIHMGIIADCTRDGREIQITTSANNKLKVYESNGKIIVAFMNTRNRLTEIEIQDEFDLYSRAWELAERLVAYIQTNFIMSEINPPFIDLSVNKPLESKDLEDVKRYFSVVDPETLRGGGLSVQRMNTIINGSQNQPKLKQAVKYVYKMDVRVPPMIKRAMVLVKSSSATGLMAHNPSKMRKSLLDVAYRGKMPHTEMHYRVVWGTGRDEGDLIFEQTNNICDYITVNVLDKNNKIKRATVHTTPSFTVGFEDLFTDELIHFVENFQHPTIDWDQRVDIPLVMRGIWSNCTDIMLFVNGYVYYRDGRWGGYYDIAGHGVGNLLQRKCHRQLYFGYTFTSPENYEENAGLVRFFSDSNNAETQGARWIPGWTDVNWNFYPGQPVKDIIHCVFDYMHAY